MAQGTALDSSSGLAMQGPPSLPSAHIPPPLPGTEASVAARWSQPADSAELKGESKPAAEGEPATAGTRGAIPVTWVEAGSAASVSVIFHMIIVIALGLWMIPAVLKPEPSLIRATLVDERVEEEKLNEVLERQPVASTAVTLASSVASVQAGLPQSAPSMTRPEIPQEFREAPQAPTVQIDLGTILPASSGEFSAAVPAGTRGDALVPVGSYQQAMSRLTQEILGYMAKGPVTVVWCFDQSESMRDDYVEIREYLRIVFEELNLVGAPRTGALQMIVTSYGKSFGVHSKRPMTSLEEVQEAMDTIPVDPSGMEMQCSAIKASVALAGKSVGRQVMLVLVSDESGQPEENNVMLEDTIAVAKAARVPIYVLGRESVFGFPIAHMQVTVTVPATGGGTISRQFLLPVDRGPETPLPEQLQTDGFGPRRDAFAAGFGPYEQARLARETGGIFFMLPDPEVGLFQADGTNYDVERMRPYLPDLSARVDYAAERDKFPIRAATWQIISDLNPYHPERGQYVILRMRFSPQPQTFAREARAEITKAAQYVKYLTAAEQALRTIEPQRRLEASSRWLANYDLIFAQVLAYKVRIIEYGAYLEAFLKKPKPVEVPPNSELAGWNMSSTSRTLTDAQTQALREESRYRFQRVISEHGGTPWATRAQYELGRGFGVDLNPFFRSTIRVPGRRPAQPIVPPKL